MALQLSSSRQPQYPSGTKNNVPLHQKLPPGENGAQMRHFLRRKLWRGGVRRQKECFPAPKIATREVQCSNGAFPAPEIVARWGSASERVFFCTKSCRTGKMVHKWGISRTGSCGVEDFGVRKSVFLHKKLPHWKFSAQMRLLLHRKTEYQAVRCKKECFLHQKLPHVKFSAQMGHFPHRKPTRLEYIT